MLLKHYQNGGQWDIQTRWAYKTEEEDMDLTGG